MAERWSLRLRIFLFFALIAAGGTVALVAGLSLGYRRLGIPAAHDGFVIAGVIAGITLLALAAAVWFLFDRNVAQPIERLASDLRARTHAGVERPIDARPARHLADLAPAAAAAAESLAEARGALAEAVARETVRIAEENARLAAILRDVPAGVLLCTPGHRIALYNTQAAVLLAGTGELGLDRPLFGLLREGPIRHAHDVLSRDAGGAEAIPLLCATLAGDRVLQGRMRLVRGDEAAAPSGYVLTLVDITRELAAHGARERLLSEVAEHVRRPAANLQAALEVLDAPELDPADRARLQATVVAEAGALVSWISGFGARLDATATGWWPMDEVAAGDIADALAATLAKEDLRLAAEVAPLVLRCDGFAMVQLLAAAARTFAAPAHPRLVIAPDAVGAVIDLEWDGTPPSMTRIERWLAEPLAGGYAAFTGRDALESHGTEIWPEAPGGHARLRLPIQAAWPEGVRADPGFRPEFYDFGLLRGDPRALTDARPLAGLAFVVLDTETTGLDPRADEMVQVAAVRILNGRLLTGEVLDFLVNPGRPIPPVSTAIHRITDAMVLDAPDPVEASRRFHEYAADSVLVAHNAAFDMAFLRRHEVATGLQLLNPVLDTARLSAVLFGGAADHTLDGLASRLGISLPASERHTALGDARATARILLKKLPLLREIGIVTLGDAMRAMR